MVEVGVGDGGGRAGSRVSEVVLFAVSGSLQASGFLIVQQSYGLERGDGLVMADAERFRRRNRTSRDKIVILDRPAAGEAGAVIVSERQKSPSGSQLRSEPLKASPSRAQWWALPPL